MKSKGKLITIFREVCTILIMLEKVHSFFIRMFELSVTAVLNTYTARASSATSPPNTTPQRVSAYEDPVIFPDELRIS